MRKVRIIDAVKLAYWTGRGAQETRDVLQASVANFQKTVDYHAARLASKRHRAEQDFLRVRLESERLKITANLAAIEAEPRLSWLYSKKWARNPAERQRDSHRTAGGHAASFTETPLDSVLTQRS